MIEENQAFSEDFYAIFEGSDSRTYLDDRKRMRWHEKDCVTLFRKNTYNRTYMFKGQTGANAGGFGQVSVDDEFWYGTDVPYNYAVYPHSTDVTLDETDRVLTVKMPAEQTYAENSFGVGANTMISISESSQLIFKNVGSFLRLRLYGNETSISSITMTSNGDQIISGEAKVTPVFEGDPICEMIGTGKSIRLTCPTPVAISSEAEAPTEFWIVVPPVVLSEGFSLLITNSKNNTQTFDLNQSFTFERNKYITITGEVKIINDEGDGEGDGGDNGDGEDNGEGEGDGEEIIDPSLGTPYLTFTAEKNQSFNLSKAISGLEYSLNDGEWTELGTKMVTFGGANGDLKLRGKSSFGTANSVNDYAQFNLGGLINTPVNCTGDIRTLVDYENYTTANMSEARFCFLFAGSNCNRFVSVPKLPAKNLASDCYYNMFKGCTGLTTAPDLPAKNLSVNCYSHMFDGCTNLTTAPKISATRVAENSCTYMFYNCRNLTKAPELPATVLASSCYSNMFTNCTSLTSAPELPATNLASDCYSYMFSGCSKLTAAPILSATSLAAKCYMYMFANCSSLTVAPALPATVLVPYCYSNMFYGCSSLTASPVLPAQKLVSNCYNSMFNKCTNLKQITMLATDIGAMDCLSTWVAYVSSTGTFVKAKEMTSLPNGASGVPFSWSVMNYGG